jgi:hypothetical protein
MQGTTKRGNVIYGNWLVLHPNGFEMFRCSSKKANWYLERDLANIISENPPVIKLNFEPGGIGNKDDEFALTQRKNICTVCGTVELDRLTKHHIVPSLYKKHFPMKLKVATSHDVVCICRECHDEYENIYASKLKERISEQYEVPLCNSQSDFAKVIKLSKAYVLNNSFMPEDRKMELLEKISSMMGYEEGFVPMEEIEKFSKISKKHYNEFYSNHGREVMLKVTDIQNFVEMWRNDFVENMKPKYMPKYWDIHRAIERLVRVLKTK